MEAERRGFPQQLCCPPPSSLRSPPPPVTDEGGRQRTWRVRASRGWGDGARPRRPRGRRGKKREGASAHGQMTKEEVRPRRGGTSHKTTYETSPPTPHHTTHTHVHAPTSAAQESETGLDTTAWRAAHRRKVPQRHTGESTAASAYRTLRPRASEKQSSTKEVKKQTTSNTVVRACGSRRLGRLPLRHPPPSPTRELRRR